MKRFLAIATFATAAVMLTGTAGAATFKGVVVSKDAKRKALVTASPGAVRTVRAPARFAHVKVGQRVAGNARRLSDGTFRAQSLRIVGRGEAGPLSRSRREGRARPADRRRGQ